MTWKIDWWKDGIHILLAKKRLGFKGKYNNTKTFMDTRRENQPYEMSHSTPEPWFRSLDVSLLEEIMRTEFVIWCLTNDLAT